MLDCVSPLICFLYKKITETWQWRCVVLLMQAWLYAWVMDGQLPDGLPWGCHGPQRTCTGFDDSLDFPASTAGHIFHLSCEICQHLSFGLGQHNLERPMRNHWQLRPGFRCDDQKKKQLFIWIQHYQFLERWNHRWFCVTNRVTSHKHSNLPDDESWWRWWSCIFSSTATVKLTSALSELPQ